MYTIQKFDTEAEEWVTVYATEAAIRVQSNRYADKTVFETDDPEWNG